MCLKNICSYSKLCYRLYNYQKQINYNIDNIIDSINECGAVMIKFSQWVTPKLELIYLDGDDIINENKPNWLVKLEMFYENCNNHTLEYTKKTYYSTFNENIEDKYVMKDIIGSGSIGQVYLIEDKKTKEKKVMKILHPNVKNEINFFKKFIKFLIFIPCIRNKINSIFPFDIFKFISDIENQTDLINEANHLLYFYNFYKENKYIIIPELYRISSEILIMSYESGTQFDKSTINEYQKNKIVNLFHLFIRTNQMLENYNHGDLHPGNWKIRETEDTDPKLIIYDFGFCWSIPHSKFISMGTLFWDTFEESDQDLSKSIDNATLLMSFTTLYEKEDKDTDFKNKIREYIVDYINENVLTELTVIDSLKATIGFSTKENIKLDPHLIQCYIVFIQGQKLFERYGLKSSKNNNISDYSVYRERYLDILTFCKTYNIFHEHSVYIEKKLNAKQVTITNIFDTIEMDDSIKELLIPN